MFRIKRFQPFTGIVVSHLNRLPHGGRFFLKKYSLCKLVTDLWFSKLFMRKHFLSPSEIIEALSGQDIERRKTALRYLFEDSELRQSTIAHVRHHGGNKQDGEDVFQEAIIVFDRKLRQGAFLSQGSLEAYFMGIVRWYWFNEQHRPGKAVLLNRESPPEPPPGGDPELEYLLTERKEQIETLLDQLTDKCRNLLKMYQLEYSMEEIARMMGFANGGVAKKEAFLCRQRFRVVLKKYPEIWQDFIKRK